MELFQFYKEFYKEIKLKDNKSVFVDESAEIVDWSWVLKPNNTIHRMSPSDVVDYLDSQSNATKKIVASINFLINKDILMIIEDGVKVTLED